MHEHDKYVRHESDHQLIVNFCEDILRRQPTAWHRAGKVVDSCLVALWLTPQGTTCGRICVTAWVV